MQKDNLVRIQKFISDMGVMSRRAAEKEIVAGNITINGIRASLGDKIDPNNDAIMIKNKPIIMQNKKYYILLNKPSGYITTTKDEHGRKTVTELLSDIPCRIYPAGRLDYLSEGALICTNDGDFANRVTHPSHSHEKIYHVYASGKITGEHISLLTSIRDLEGEKIAPVSVRAIKNNSTYTVLEFKLSEGKNRQIRRMCEVAKINIMQLKRISIGDVNLGNLSSGKWRHLTSAEIKSFNK